MAVQGDLTPRPGIELAAGVWATVVADRSAWDAAWAGFLSGPGCSLAGTSWTGLDWVPSGNDEKRQETFNPAREAPMKTR
jgi:hypothetical protein